MEKLYVYAYETDETRMMPASEMSSRAETLFPSCSLCSFIRPELCQSESILKGYMEDPALELSSRFRCLVKIKTTYSF